MAEETKMNAPQSTGRVRDEGGRRLGALPVVGNPARSSATAAAAEETATKAKTTSHAEDGWVSMDQINEQNAEFLRYCDELGDDEEGDSDDDDDDDSGGNGTCDGDLEELDADGVSILRETSSTLRISEADADDVLLNNIAYARSERDLLGVDFGDEGADEGRKAHGVRVLQDAKRLVAAANGDVCKQLLGARLLATYGKLLVLRDPGCGGGGLKKNVSTTWDAPCEFRGVVNICLESIEDGDGGRRRLLEDLKTKKVWIGALNRTVFPAFRKAGFTNGDLVCSRGMGVGEGTVEKATQCFPIALPGREESCTGPVQLQLRFPPVDQVIADAAKAAEATHKNTVRDVGGASADAATPAPTPGGDAIGSRLSSDRGRIVVGVDIPFGRTRAQFATVEHGILENLKEMHGVSSADLKVGGHVPEGPCKSGGERLGPGTWLEHKQKMKRLSHEEESRTNVAKRFAGVTGELARAADRVRDSVRGALPEDVVLQVSASIAAVKAELPRFAREFGLAVPSGALPQPVDVDLAM